MAPKTETCILLKMIQFSNIFYFNTAKGTKLISISFFRENVSLLEAGFAFSMKVIVFL